MNNENRPGWKECKLGEVAILNYGKGLPEHKRKQGNIPVYSSAGITGWHNEALIDNKGIIVGRKGTIGTVYYTEKPFYCIDTAYYIKPDEQKYNLKYLFYLLGTLNLKELNEDSAVPGLNRDTAYSQDIFLPPLPEQRAIAGVLSSLDDKIDLLHRQNKTLEGMAEALWRKMFVEEADPGWDEKGLDEIANFLNGLPCQKYPPDISTESLPVIKIKELRTGITDDSDSVTAKVPSEYIIDDGDILFSWSGSLEVVIWSFGKGVLNQHLFKVTSDDYPKWFCYYWIKHHLAEFRDIAQDKATTMGHIQRHHLSAAKVLIPDKKSFEYLNTQISPVFEKMMHNLKTIRKFVHLRDSLLPKMMSSEVRVQI